MNHIMNDRRKFRAAMRDAERGLPTTLPGLFYLTDPERTKDPIQTAAKLPSGTGILYRHFGAQDRAQQAARLSEISAQRGLLFVIAADPELALQVGAHGVHWPEAKRRQARRWASAFALQTTSAHSPAALRHAAAMGFDAAFLSTVFTSGSASAGKATGPIRFRRLAQSVNLRVYALGGIAAGTGGRVTGAGGLASIAGIEAAYGETNS